MNISPIEFIEDPRLIGDKSLSPAQKMVIKAIYGLRMDSQESDLFGQAGGGRRYVEGVEQDEITILKGRKAGGTDKILTNCLLYETCMRPPKLAVGERAVAQIVTSELKRQSRVCYDYCRGKLERSPILWKLVKNVIADEIELTNGCVILIFPCVQGRVRSPSVLFFGGDEVCFWKTEGRSMDKEVLDAARPGLIFPYAKMIKLSSVGAMRGEMYQDYKRFYGVDNAPVLVLKGSTEFFFPGFSKAKLERERRRDPVAFDAEYLGNFRADRSSMYDPDIIDRSVNPDRPMELAFRQQNAPYTAFVDVAGGGGRDSYALAFGHREGEKIIIDVVRSRAPKFNPEEVTAQYCELLKGYGIREVYGDKFSGDFASNSYAKYKVEYKRAEKSKSELYLEAEGPFNTGRVFIPSREPLISQLRNLVRKTRSGGRDSVDTDSGQPEDEANVVCGLVDLLAGEAGRYVRDDIIAWNEPAGPADPEEDLGAESVRWLLEDSTSHKVIDDRSDEEKEYEELLRQAEDELRGKSRSEGYIRRGWGKKTR